MNDKSSHSPRAFLYIIALLFLASVQIFAGQPKSMTRQEVDAAIAQLDRDETRLEALDRLLAFAGARVYQVGSVIIAGRDQEQNALWQKAADAIARHRDPKTLWLALNSPNRSLQYWALFFFKLPEDATPDSQDVLLKRIRDLAWTGEGNIRQQAQERLSQLPGHREFLDKCLVEETSPENIMRLLQKRDVHGYPTLMLPRLLALLTNSQASVRHGALLFIGFNSHRAPMWQFNIDLPILTRVLELSHSQDDKERSDAVYALVDLRLKYPDEVRKRMLEMIEDPCEDVRWRIPGALQDQKNREDVKPALERLLKDKAPSVRYFTIIALGPDQHLAELEALAEGPDPKIAEMAKPRVNAIKRQKAGPGSLAP